VKIKLVQEALQAEILEGDKLLAREFNQIYASDLMSDVLAFGTSDSLLLTGLANQQAVISAHMAEFIGVVYIRGKKPPPGSERFAREHQMVLLSTNLDMFDSCVRINARQLGGEPPKTSDNSSTPSRDILLERDLLIEGSDFASAGMVSTEVKTILKQIGLDPTLIRRVAISTYEGEMNVVMHARNARVKLLVTQAQIQVIIDDNGKGIPDVEQAMQAGFTTSTAEQRAMGFGSGMGLPNIKKNSDHLDVTSTVGKGTRLIASFDI